MPVNSIKQALTTIRREYDDQIKKLEKELKDRKRIAAIAPELADVPPEDQEAAAEKQAEIAQQIRLIEQNKREALKDYLEKRGRIARSLRKFSAIRGHNFRKRSRKDEEAAPTTTIKALSKTQEAAYYCGNCSLWILGNPMNDTVLDSPEGRSYQYFCEICGCEVGRTKPEFREKLENCSKS